MESEGNGEKVQYAERQFFCDVCMDDLSKCAPEKCPGAPHPDDPHKQAEEARQVAETTCAAYALNLLHGAEIAPFEVENLIDLAARVGAKVSGHHQKLAAQRDAKAAAVKAKLDERDRLREALGRARDQFRAYERLHSLKPDGSGKEKAKVNGEFADMCDRALSGAG